MNFLATVGGFIANISASKVTTDIIKSLTPEQTGKIGKFLTVIGTMVIGGMVGSAAESYTKKEVKKFTEAVKLLGGNKDGEDDESEESGDEDN